MIRILIGQNGYGKTTSLREKKKELIDSEGIEEKDILFLESEILALDEMKDTTDKTFAMEYIISEILDNSDINDRKQELSNAVDNAISSNIDLFNSMIDEVMAFNGQQRTGNFISTSDSKEYKKFLKINSNDLKNKVGSGQRMQFILSLVKNSSKTHIFLDEPEKHSHPSLLNYTAKLIRELSENRNLYIATHSPKLVEMLDFEFDNIEVYNDPNFGGSKSLDFDQAILVENNYDVSLLYPKSQTYYNPVQLKTNIKELHLKDFIESIFSKKVYIVEGVNDELFLRKMLKNNNRHHEDYYIFVCYGKQHFLPFINLFESLSIEVVVFYDEDNIDGRHGAMHRMINDSLSLHKHYKFIADIEREIGYRGDKGNVVEFITFLDTLDIDPRYNI